jgi:hypothetical protein
MKTLVSIITLGLAVAFAAPALAAYPEGERNVSAQHDRAMHEHRAEVFPRRAVRSVRGEINDPYWTPCDYSESWSTNGC